MERGEDREAFRQRPTASMVGHKGPAKLANPLLTAVEVIFFGVRCCLVLAVPGQVRIRSGGATFAVEGRPYDASVCMRHGRLGNRRQRPSSFRRRTM